MSVGLTVSGSNALESGRSPMDVSFQLKVNDDPWIQADDMFQAELVNDISKTVELPGFGLYTIQVNACNYVSFIVLQTEVTVQEEITGLDVLSIPIENIIYPTLDSLSFDVSLLSGSEIGLNEISTSFLMAEQFQVRMNLRWSYQ